MITVMDRNVKRVVICSTLALSRTLAPETLVSLFERPWP
jgi:hypothetical protein